jgi:hypothetical protein
MPLLHFDVRMQDDNVVDEWLWFPNLETARREAAEVAAEIVRETGTNVSIAIKDKDGQPVQELTKRRR